MQLQFNYGELQYPKSEMLLGNFPGGTEAVHTTFSVFEFKREACTNNDFQKIRAKS